jgi:predicted ATPase
MQLLYIWVDSYKNIKNKGFSFSPNHKIEIAQDDVQEISGININEIKNDAQLFPDLLNNITGLIGKNGSGKTNILDIIGMNIDQRRTYRRIIDSYFLLYKISNNQYVIEGSQITLIQPFTNGLDGLDIDNPYSIIVRYDKKQHIFNFIEFLNKNQKVMNSLDVLSTKRQEYNSRVEITDKANSWLFERISLQPSFIGYYPKYKMLVDFNTSNYSHRGELFRTTNRVFLRITSSLDYYKNNDFPIKLKVSLNSFKRKKKESSEELKLEKEISPKYRWILSLTEDYIYFTWYSLVAHLKDKEDEIKTILNKIEAIVLLDDNHIEGYYVEVLRILMAELWNCSNDYAKGQNLFFSDYDELSRLLFDLPESVFTEKEIEVPIGEAELIAIKNLLIKLDQEYLKSDSPNLLNKILEVNFYPFSSGEESLLDLFATLYRGITLKEDDSKQTLILLLDEPDQFLHPEWCRQLIWELIEFLKRTSGYEKYQVVFTTHSPFLVSDLPSSHIITLDKDPKTGECIVSSPRFTIQTFASNIHTLLADKFFLDSTTGELALQTINWIIRKLNSSRTLGKREKKKIHALIELIGEPIIRQRLVEMYQLKEPEDKEVRLNNLLLQKQKIQQEIDQIEREKNDSN